MVSNFTFLQVEWQELHQHATEAETFVMSSTRTSAFYSRLAMETAVRWMYDHDSSLQKPYDTSLVALLNEQSFVNVLPPNTAQNLHYIRKVGNDAAHASISRAPSEQQALSSLKMLYGFLSFFSYAYSEHRQPIPPFSEANIPTTPVAGKSLEEIQALQEEYQTQVEEINKQKALLAASEAARNALQKQLAEIQERKENNRKKAFTVETPVSEAETRRLFIDLLLREAGWNPTLPHVQEYPVTGMPTSVNPSGKGYADYVLWGEDGKPLAVVEAKKTLRNAQEGQYQAELYANCLEQMTGQRPLIFYTNGFRTFLWDDQFYPPRQVQGFYTRDELQWLIGRRQGRKDLTRQTVNAGIADRYYQKEAIQRVSESLMNKSRSALLVMATGSGKTRTAAALVDLLMKGGWVRRVLFLADRNALVRQARGAFKKYLPHLTQIDLTEQKENDTSRMVFSTYPTMMNRIDGARVGDNRFYSPGYFDLIIIDEAHRSVYLKYKAIFDYFDAILIGLTATPKAEVDKNTYELFHLENNNPTYAYELNQAVADTYLVPPKALEVPLKFHREGIRYQDLNEQEKDEYEMSFRDEETGELPGEIDASALNNWLFNQNTVDKVLTYLMERGIKVEGGDKLGKTIIFARNHRHALYIEERFNELYPQYRGKFLRVIDNFEKKAQGLLDDFSEVSKFPQIAVSVDMLDTGVDIPEVVNLVFFKTVKSKAKFWQMIGRGTRLRPDLFGPGQPKTHFCVFDFCENFEFFDAHPEGLESNAQESVSQKIFKTRLRLSQVLQGEAYVDEPHQSLRTQLLDQLHASVAQLSDTSFTVRQHWATVLKFRQRENWDYLNQTDVLELTQGISGLVLPEGEDELARRFDLMILNFQLSLPTESKSQKKYVTQLSGIAHHLGKKKNIPAVVAHMSTISAMQTDGFWSQVGMTDLERVRGELRGLMNFIDKDERAPVYTNFEDSLDYGAVKEHEIIPLGSTLPNYRLRVERFIRENKDHITISRLYTNQPITLTELEQLEQILFDGDERGTKEDFQREYGSDQPLTLFIRSIIGLDVQAARKAFSDFLGVGALKADQITFIDKIIEHLTVNGVIDRGRLFEPPFTDIHDQGVLGVFPETQVSNLLSIIDRINANAGVA